MPGKKIEEKPKAQRLGINQLVVTAAYEKTFSTGKKGFFGQVIDPATGQKYQVIGAVAIGS
ncbi:MAG: hypothetical protein PHW33_01725 [Candidatus Portnoybacteria bacterium]|jgi:hypothetical protein|nr:hypothetical protein [Candidatus Portnoybacteria bacterium]